MLREIVQTPEDEAIEGAAEYTGIEPERLEAAIREYKRLLPDSRKADCHEELWQPIETAPKDATSCCSPLPRHCQRG